MSVWLLIGAGLLAWTVVSIAFGLFLGRIVSAQRRGGYIDAAAAARVASQMPRGGEVLLTHRESARMDEALRARGLRWDRVPGGSDQAA